MHLRLPTVGPLIDLPASTYVLRLQACITMPTVNNFTFSNAYTSGFMRISTKKCFHLLHDH